MRKAKGTLDDAIKAGREYLGRIIEPSSSVTAIDAMRDLEIGMTVSEIIGWRNRVPAKLSGWRLNAAELEATLSAARRGVPLADWTIRRLFGVSRALDVPLPDAVLDYIGDALERSPLAPGAGEASGARLRDAMIVQIIEHIHEATGIRRTAEKHHDYRPNAIEAAARALRYFPSLNLRGNGEISEATITDLWRHRQKSPLQIKPTERWPEKRG